MISNVGFPGVSILCLWVRHLLGSPRLLYQTIQYHLAHHLLCSPWWLCYSSVVQELQPFPPSLLSSSSLRLSFLCTTSLLHPAPPGFILRWAERCFLLRRAPGQPPGPSLATPPEATAEAVPETGAPFPPWLLWTPHTARNTLRECGERACWTAAVALASKQL